jgi:hypothetical protein
MAMADSDIMAALRDFGEVIRAGAARRAGRWSEKIPPSGRTESVRADEVLVIFGGPSAGNAYPFEVRGVRHPVFATGPRSTWNWVPNGTKITGFADGWRPYLSLAAMYDSGPALYEFAKVVDRWGNEFGFEGR